MPYIKQEDRAKYTKAIELALDSLGDDWTAGELNYFCHTIAVNLFTRRHSYQTVADIESGLKGAYDEFWRLHGAEYEEKKRKENGDVLIFGKAHTSEMTGMNLEEWEKFGESPIGQFIETEQKKADERLSHVEFFLNQIKIKREPALSAFDYAKAKNIEDSVLKSAEEICLVQLQKMPTIEAAKAQRTGMLETLSSMGILCKEDESWHENDTKLRIKLLNPTQEQKARTSQFACVISVSY